MTFDGLLHAWALAFVLAAFLALIAIVPAFLFGLRVRAFEVLEAVCWLALGVLALAEVAVVA